MRNFLVLLALLLVGCGGTGDNGANGGTDIVPQPPPQAAQHVPLITSLAVSPNVATNMQGDGGIVISAEIGFRDDGLDIGILYIRMPDGATLELNRSTDTAGGSFVEDLTVSTTNVGVFALEFWLEDRAGGSSSHHTADFRVVEAAHSGDWTRRLSGLPYVLNDVIWNGNVFVAVGYEGAILTSADGIDWVPRESGTDANLNAVATFGSEIFAVGDQAVLFSTDHGEHWSVDGESFRGAYLTAVTVTSSQVVVSGSIYDLAIPFIVTSEDRGNTWQRAVFWTAGDLIYRDGIFVGTEDRWFDPAPPRVIVSSDGKVWNEIIVSDEGPPLNAIVHDGSQFIVAANDSTAFASFDGYNWTELQTPEVDVDYLSAAWSGSKLVLAGGPNLPLEQPVGIASIDGGITWGTFNIHGYFQSHGLAWGNGRFVSVGQTAPWSGEGAIYTAD